MAIKPRTILTTDVNGLPSFQEMTTSKESFNFGDKVGLMVFRGWYPCISDPYHFANSQAYDFPVRIGFVGDPFNLDNIVNHGATDAWNVEQWINSAKQLEEDGCKALVGGCGLTAMIQSKLTEAVNIPVFTSTVMFVPLLQKTIKKDKRVAILTVNLDSLSMNNGSLFDECGFDKDSVIIAGMDQSKYSEDWAIQFNDKNYDKSLVEKAIVSMAMDLVRAHEDIGQIVLECTEMPPFSDAVRKATGLPVFDAVDMAKMAYLTVK